MKSQIVKGVLVLLVIFLCIPSLGNISQAREDDASIRSVEERRVLAAIAEQKARLLEKEEVLQQRELELKTLESEVDKKLVELEKVSSEVAALLERQGESGSKRRRELSAMYEKMAPEKAAALLTAIEEDLAIDILAGMKSKTAGRVLGNMDRAKAAKLSQAYSGQ